MSMRWIALIRDGKDGEVYEVDVISPSQEEAEAGVRRDYPDAELLEIVPNDPDAVA